MNKESIYSKLESQMLKYADLVDVSVIPIKHRMVRLRRLKGLEIKQIGTDMRKITGINMLVRSGVAQRLEKAANVLCGIDGELALQVVYGYRALEIQSSLYNSFKKKLEPSFSGMELEEAVHRLVANPKIAGHPTGGAVDIQILKKGKPINMGTKIWEFKKDSYTFSPFVSRSAMKNRMLLREVLMGEGFAPFDGEWWHFSYGDKEWAKYYDKPAAIYEQVNFKQAIKNTK